MPMITPDLTTSLGLNDPTLMPNGQEHTVGEERKVNGASQTTFCHILD